MGTRPRWRRRTWGPIQTGRSESRAACREMFGTEVTPGRLNSSLQFIDKKLSVSRSLRLYSRLLLVRRTDQQHRFVWAAPDNPSPGPSRAGRPITGRRHGQWRASRAFKLAGGARGREVAPVPFSACRHSSRPRAGRSTDIRIESMRIFKFVDLPPAAPSQEL